MITDEKKRGRGRPRKPVVDGERYLLTARLTPRTREKIAEAAGRNGRSLTQEAEARLEQSFRDEELLGGPGTAGVLRMLAGVIAKVEEDTGKSWRKDYETARAVHAAMALALRAYSPPDQEGLNTPDLLDRQGMEPDPELEAMIKEKDARLDRAYDLGHSLMVTAILAQQQRERE